MRRFLAIFTKEVRQLRRDRLSLGMLFLLPVLLLALYGYALSFDVKHIPVAVLDEDRTRDSREFLESLFGNPYFDRVRTLERREESDAILDRGQARVVLVVPRGFAQRLARGETARVQALVDGADANSAGTAVGYLDALAARATRKVRLEALGRAGAGTALPLVTPVPRIWFNPEMESSHFLIPGLIAMLMMLAAVVATSLSLVREKERRTLDQIRVSPVHPLELIAGKMLPYVIVGVATMGLILLLGRLAFGVVVAGSWWLLGAATLLFLFGALAMGLMISSLTDSQQLAFQLATILTLLPSFLLSGLIFPIKSMPVFHQYISALFLPRHFVTALRGIMLRDAALADLWPSLAAMLVLGLAFNLVALARTRRSL
jgi:ABC-2 type transport system permease protein